MKTRKMVIRADDIGYTDVCNIGTFKAIDAGLVTQMDVMLECPGSVDAFRRIRNYPWISMGWHMHFWGSPVLDPREVPSLLAENGHFKQSLAKHTDIEYDEIYREMDAQMQRCMEIAGRIPQVSSMYDPGPDATPFQLAAIEICKKYNIHYGFATRLNKQQDVDSGRHPALVQPAREPYRDLDIAQPGPGFAYQGLKDGPLGSYTQYDPIKNYLIADPDHLADHRVGFQAWHPGYVDDYIMFDDNPTKPHMTWNRVIDVEWMTSERAVKAIVENKIELINTMDAIFGTNVYQDHLKEIGSPLWVGNFAD